MLKFKSEIKKNRNGQFFSLTIFLIIGAMLIFFAIINKTLSNEENFNINRLEGNVENKFVSDFDNVYSKQILSTSLKPAIAGVLLNNEKVSKDKLVTIMMEGDINYIDPDLSIQKLLSGIIISSSYSETYRDEIFIMNLTKVEQINPYLMRFTFNVNYEFIIGNNEWSKKNKEIIIDVDIYSLNHPYYNDIIDEDWIIDSSAVECFSNQVFIDAEPCLGLNVMPLNVTY